MFVRHAISGALIAAAALTAACSDQSPTAIAEHDTAAFGHNAQGGAARGTTGGWFDGKDVTFFYNKDFFCPDPADESAADSNCALGVEPKATPRGGNIPVVYVMTPLGFTPPNLHCPVVGDCINHPSTIDASRLFGDGARNLPLPAHSHIVDQRAGGWWEIEVIGVTDPGVWNQIAAAKNLTKVRELQAAGVGITGDIASNLFLFFNVQP